MEEERLLKIAISRTVDPMRERGAEESVSEGDKGAEGVSASSGELGWGSQQWGCGSCTDTCMDACVYLIMPACMAWVDMCG